MLESHARSLEQPGYAPWMATPRRRTVALPELPIAEPVYAPTADAATTGTAVADGQPLSAADVVAQLADNRPLLRAYLRLQIGRHADIDDLEQDISVALWREAASFDASRSFTAWMLGFARIHVLRWRQKRSRDRRIIALDDLGHDHVVWVGEQIAAEGDSSDALARCLRQLDQPSTDLLRWRYEDGLALADIAKRLRLSVATASRRLSRLVRVLDGCIRERLDRAEGAKS